MIRAVKLAWLLAGAAAAWPLDSLLQGIAPNVTLEKRTTVAAGIELRILPLGDSITYGLQSSTGNGYRGPLQADLQGSDLLFVGTVSEGSMSDNYNDGYPGATISQIASYAPPGLAFRPNVILIHAGTNDLNRNPLDQPFDQAPQRLMALLNEVVVACPDAVILVAQIIPSTYSSDYNPRHAAYNAQIPGIVSAFQVSGYKMEVVNMQGMPTSDLSSDGVHPDDEGYAWMANAWFDAIQTAASQGLITKPVGLDPSPQQLGKAGASCLSEPNWNNIGQIAKGIASLQGGTEVILDKDWVNQGQIAKGLGPDYPVVDVRWADLNGDGQADYLWVDPTTGALYAYLNELGYGSTGNFVAVNGGTAGIPIAKGAGTNILFGDIDGDGKDDYLQLADDGSGQLTCWFNNGPDPSAANGWSWDGPHVVAKGVNGTEYAALFVVDINGDGRDDYVTHGPSGELNLWLNTAPGIESRTGIVFQACGQIAKGTGNPAITLQDIDGNGRVDYLVWDNDGGLSGFLNYPGSSDCDVSWQDLGNDKSVAKGIGVPYAQIRLADIDGDGKADYLYMDPSGPVIYYQNECTVETGSEGGHVLFADIDGDGLDDYIVVDPVTGAPTVYLNGGGSIVGQWQPLNGGQVIAKGAAPGAQIVFADIDGDGRADYNVVDPSSGAVSCWLNQGPDSSAAHGWSWNEIGPIAKGLGVGSSVRLADVDGDGKADYLFLGPDSSLTAYKNVIPANGDASLGSNFIPWDDPQNPVAVGTGAAANLINFADMDGDGKADWVQIEDSSIEVWIDHLYNFLEGTQDVDTHWGPNPYVTEVSFGTTGASGESVANIQFPTLTNSGRADYVVIDPATGAVDAWINECADPASGSGGNPPKGSGTPIASGQVVTYTSAGQVYTTTLFGGGQPPGSSYIPGGGPSPTSKDSTTLITTTNAQGQTTVLTDTLVATTATNSNGVTFVGTITEGPSVTPTFVGTGLTTYSTFPPGVRWSSTSVPSNTHDSSGDPVFGPWPGCWFCPPGSHGIVVFGLLPGVYPGGGPPAGLPTPFPPLTIEPDGDPVYGTEPATESRPSCTSSAVSSCRETITLSTSWYPGYSSFTVSTGSSISCVTATTCGRTATTSTTTTATGPALASCSPGSGLCSGCSSKRKRDIVPVVYDNSTLVSRDILGVGRQIWSRFVTFYNTLKNSPATIDPGSGDSKNPTTAVIVKFNNENRNVYVDGLEGCTVLVVVSTQGAYMAHFFEDPSMEGTPAYFQQTVLTPLSNGAGSTTPRQNGNGEVIPADQLGDQPLTIAQQKRVPSLLQLKNKGNIFANGDDISIFLMTASDTERAPNSQALDPGTGKTIDPADQTNFATLEQYLRTNFPGAPLSTYVYDPQRGPVDAPADELPPLIGPVGRAVVEYSPSQSVDPVTGEDLPAGTAVWQVWMQSKSMGYKTWSAYASQTCSGNEKRQEGGACSLISSSSPTTASHPPTTTTSATSTVTSASPTVGQLNCFPATYTPSCNMGDVEPGNVQKIVAELCSGDPTYQPTYTISADTEPAADSLNYNSQVQYNAVVSWIPGCHYTPQEIHYPLGSGHSATNCSELLQSTYSGCRANNGHGGYVDVACLRYQFLPQGVQSNGSLCPAEG